MYSWHKYLGAKKVWVEKAVYIHFIFARRVPHFSLAKNRGRRNEKEAIFMGIPSPPPFTAANMAV